jgi:branched-chain amino acid transport system substrate-binding protein
MWDGKGLTRVAVVAGTLLGVLAGVIDAAPALALNIYSSLPRQGTSRGQAISMERGARLALADAGGSAGGPAINYIPLDDSTRRNPGTADLPKTLANARRVAGDADAIAYIGELNSDGTKVSLPVLNRAGILQVSPSNTYIGLTVSGPGAVGGEPGRYYPTGRRTYGRIVPNDVVQGAALATLMKDAHCRSAFLVGYRSTYSQGIVASVRAAARGVGLRVSGSATAGVGRRAILRLARRVRGPCVMFGGVTGDDAVNVFRVLAAAHPRARFFAPDGVAEEAFTNPRVGGIPLSVARRTWMTVAKLDWRGFPPAGRALLPRLSRDSDPFAAYGYEAMSVVLDSIRRSSVAGVTRQAVVDAFFATRDRAGVLGTYSIDANGDTSSHDFGVYRVVAGLPTYDRKVTARGLP